MHPTWSQTNGPRMQNLAKMTSSPSRTPSPTRYRGCAEEQQVQKLLPGLPRKTPLAPAQLLALPSPNSIFYPGKGQVAESCLVGGWFLLGNVPWLLSYFHKPIITDHLRRLRPCLSPIQPGLWRGGELDGCVAPRPLPHHPVAIGTCKGGESRGHEPG